MASTSTILSVKFSVFVVIILLSAETKAKLSENKTNVPAPELKAVPKTNGGATLLFADDLKQILEKYLFGVCPQNFKSRWTQMLQGGKGKNNVTTLTCDLDPEQQDLPGRLASLALRAHSISRSDCSRLGAVLANTFGELARTAANRNAMNTAAGNEVNKKRKLSKSQKAKLEAKQRTALAVKKKAAARAAAAAAATAAKMTS